MSTPSTALAPRGQFDLSPQTFDQALTFANYLAESEMVPKQYRGRPGDCLIAMQWGMEIGLKPLQALQSIAPVNGKPNLYGDAGKAMLLAAGCEIDEDDVAIIRSTGVARCKITRPGRRPTERTFSIDDAKTAQLWGKAGPWTTSPYRQMAWRAFWFAARDAAADLLRGMGGAEESADYSQVKEMGAVDGATHAAATVPPAAPASYSQADFDKNMPAWAKAIAAGKKSMDAVISTVEAKAPLTDGQKAALAAEVKKLEPQDVIAKTTTGTPQVKAATLEKRLREAPGLDQLYEAAGLMDAITDTEIRADLDQVFNERLHELGG